MVTEKHEVLAVIPARGGSKSIPRKNIQLLDGHPLIAYSIAAGQQAKLVTRVLVTTDDDEIADVARTYGADVPFVRPKHLAADDTVDYPVIKHCIDWLAAEEGYIPDIIVQLRPTSPLRPIGCVDMAVEILAANPNADSIRGVIPSGQNPYKMWRIQDGIMIPLLQYDLPEPYNQPRQSLPNTYWQTGHIDAIRRDTITTGSLTGKVILPLEIDPVFAIDIDKPLDLETAERVIGRVRDRIVMPHRQRSGEVRRDISGCKLLVLDFDGVLTDNSVVVSETGEESVICSRSDGFGIRKLKEAGIDVVILSTEKNPVVSARATKLGLDCYQGINNKLNALVSLANERHLPLSQIAFIGNDENDLECIREVGWGVAVKDAEPVVLNDADIVLERKGGQGAVREFCEMLTDKLR